MQGTQLNQDKVTNNAAVMFCNIQTFSSGSQHVIHGLSFNAVGSILMFNLVLKVAASASMTFIHLFVQ